MAALLDTASQRLGEIAAADPIAEGRAHALSEAMQMVSTQLTTLDYTIAESDLALNHEEPDSSPRVTAALTRTIAPELNSGPAPASSATMPVHLASAPAR